MVMFCEIIYVEFWKNVKRYEGLRQKSIYKINPKYQKLRRFQLHPEVELWDNPEHKRLF